MCCVALRGLGKLGVCGRGGSAVGFLGLSCVFALAGVLFSSLGFPQEENSPKPEPQLKQKPCLAGWRCPKLGFWFVVGVFPGFMVWPDAES